MALAVPAVPWKPWNSSSTMPREREMSCCGGTHKQKATCDGESVAHIRGGCGKNEGRSTHTTTCWTSSERVGTVLERALPCQSLGAWHARPTARRVQMLNACRKPHGHGVHGGLARRMWTHNMNFQSALATCVQCMAAANIVSAPGE